MAAPWSGETGAQRRKKPGPKGPGFPGFRTAVVGLGAGGSAHAGDDGIELGLDGRAQGGHGRDDDDGDQG
eukprot:gene23981-44610_t